MQQQLLAIIAVANPDTLLEVSLDQHPQGGQSIELRRLSWGEGVGWYGQQTLRLDTTEAEALLRALKQHRNKWQAKSTEPKRKVLLFPGLADRQEKSRQQIA